MVDLGDTGLDPEEPGHQPLLRNLQGNILKPHGRRYVRLLLLAFRSDPQTLRGRLRQAAEVRPTSAWEQHVQNRQHKGGRSTGTFRSFMLTVGGMRALELPLAALDRHPGGASLFRQGMAAAAANLGDDASSRELLYDGSIDAMVLLADDNATRLESASAVVIAALQGVADCLGQEVGLTLFDQSRRRIEHFGHVDGRSQPVFFKADVELEKGGGTGSWDPTAPLRLVLVTDPFSSKPESFGSYCVLRKLEQNVKRYGELLSELGKTLAGVPPELLDAWVVGRFADGTPVDLRSTASQPPAPDPPVNDFAFRNDGDGARCPLQAHLRKVNPRGGTIGLGAQLGSKDLAEEKMHRIVRRGIPYGTREGQDLDPPALLDRPESGVGLLFMCYQSDISDQFAFIQKRWANNRDFQSAGAGFDPVIGSAGTGSFTPQIWSQAWDQTPGPSFAFGEVVRVKGGEFFFAPSLAFFEP